MEGGKKDVTASTRTEEVILKCISWVGRSFLKLKVTQITDLVGTRPVTRSPQQGMYPTGKTNTPDTSVGKRAAELTSPNGVKL